MPEGAAQIDDDSKTIQFENPHLFDPNKNIYVYEVDSTGLTKENIRKVDEVQYAVLGADHVKPHTIHEIKAGEVLKYYKILNSPLKP